MESKVEKEMMQIFRHLNNKGYTLLNSVISLFIVTLVLVSVLMLLRTSVMISKKTTDQIEYLSVHQNEESEIIFELCK